MTDLPERLRKAADAHRPDRERMLARVEHAMAADGAHDSRGHDRPPAAPWMRVTAVTAAVAGAIGIGGLAVGAVTGDSPQGGTVVTSGGTSSAVSPAATGTSGSADGRVPLPRHSTAVSGHRRSSAAPRGTAGRTTPALPPTPAPPPDVQGTSPAPSGGRPGGPQPQASDGPLSSHGGVAATSNDYWRENDVELTTAQALTSLIVELRIAVHHGEQSTGSWSSAPGGIPAQVTVEGQDLVYRWTLGAGQTLAPGTYTFAGQYNHAQGQDGTDGDSYTVTAGYGSGATAAVGGGF